MVQATSESYIVRATLAINEQQDPLARLPDLARRLGVDPKKPGSPPSPVLMTKAGVSYDLFDLINAGLDRIDNALKE